MEIIAHRGFWNDVSEQNSDVAFERALSNGFGIETDLRDYNQKIVISHDIANNSSMTLIRFLEICNKYSNKLVLALNVKSDGLQEILRNTDIGNKHFYFDMSVPDMFGFLRKDMVFYSRYSDVELSPSLYDKADGIWLDNFSDAQLNIDALERFLEHDKSVVLVSPELHKRKEFEYWQTLKNILNEHPEWANKIALCTDFPSKARDFFHG
ncbi:hypothetical protein [Vibrio sp. MA40-2]|uniref:hypothetical protein n=1 Tax=Vibrio sp. MA40-2 TaxID=3391828 RepID=UPI0039A6A025